MLITLSIALALGFALSLALTLTPWLLRICGRVALLVMPYGIVRAYQLLAAVGHEVNRQRAIDEQRMRDEAQFGPDDVQYTVTGQHRN